MQLEHLSAASGKRQTGIASINVQGISVDLPVVLINGSYPGPALTVTAGIHGAEYPCVEAAVRLGRTIDPATLSGQLTILPSANPLAFKARSIYTTPPDGKNLNRQFPGDPNGSFSEAWAAWLFQNAIAPADAYIDLHGGDMVEALLPFVSYDVTGREDVDSTAKRMAEAFGIRHALAREHRGEIGGTTIEAAANAGVPALLAEAGGQGVLTEADVAILYSGVIRVMAELGMLKTEVASELTTAESEQIEWLSGWTWYRAKQDGLFYPSVKVGDFVEAGARLGHVSDFFGETMQTESATAAGVVLFLVTSLAIGEGDPLMAIAY